MPILKKTAQMLKNSMHLLIFINLIFAVTTFSLMYVTGKKIQNYFQVIYSYAPQLQELQSILSEDVSMADLNKLNEAMAVINQSYKMVLIVTITSLTAFFLVWCFFQSLEWKIAYNSLKKKIKLEELFDKNYLKYALNFLIITIPAFIVMIPLFYYFLAQIMILIYNMNETAQAPSYLTTALLFLVILLMSYFTMISYVMLNKNKLLDAVKKTFQTGVKKIHVLLPIHFLGLITIIPILYIDSYFVRFFNFKISAIISLLVYFAFIAYYQVLMVSLLEKE